MQERKNGSLFGNEESNNIGYLQNLQVELGKNPTKFDFEEVSF